VRTRGTTRDPNDIPSRQPCSGLLSCRVGLAFLSPVDRLDQKVQNPRAGRRSPLGRRHATLLQSRPRRRPPAPPLTGTHASRAACSFKRSARGMRHLLLLRRLLSSPAMARASVSSSAAAAKALLPLNRLPSLLPACRLPAPGSGRAFRGASLRCYAAAAAAVAEQGRIKVQNPIVEMDGTLDPRSSLPFVSSGCRRWGMMALLLCLFSFQGMR
jgi:hypothetical protein